MQPEALGRALRHSQATSMRARRSVIAFGVTAAASLGVVLLYQIGILRHLPDPPWALFDSDRVTGSGEGYARGAMPDAALGLASSVVTVALAAAGAPTRARTRPWLPVAQAAKVSLDTGIAVAMARQQWVRHKALCSWCLVAAAALAASLVPSVAEGRQALRAWHRHREESIHD